MMRVFRVLVVLAMVGSMIATGGAAVGVETSNGPYVPNELIVGMQRGGDLSSVVTALGARVDRAITGGSAYVLSVGNPVAAAAVARSLSGVRYAEPNLIRSLHDHSTGLESPNDTDFGLKWDLFNAGTLSDGSDVPTHGADIDFLIAYNELVGVSLTETIVAILDTGIDAGHPDFVGKLATGYDAFDGDTNPADGYGHGTHVAGIAAAATDNNEGTSGVGFHPAVKIMPVKVCDDNGSCPSDAIASGVYAARNAGARVINMSFGGAGSSQTEQDAFAAAYEAGILLVASAGNSNVASQNYPAAYEPWVMAIAATDWDDQKASYSNYGADWVDLAAPGGDMSGYGDPEGIYSTMPTYNVYLTSCRARGLLSPCYDQRYDHLQGTSMAAPQVAGAAALLYAMGMTSPVDVRGLIESTAERQPGTENLWANGRLNIGAAVLAVGVTPGLTVAITEPDGTVPVSGTVSLVASVANGDGSETVTFEVTGEGYTSGSISASKTSDGVWTAPWSTTAENPPDGAYEITAAVADATGSASDSVMVELDNVDEYPTVQITSPADGATISGTVSLEAGASDDRGVASVDFKVTNSTGTVTVGAADLDGNGTWTATWDSTDSPGQVTIEAVATDNGAQTASHSITVTVEQVQEPAISLGATAYKVRGVKHADLSWSGAISTYVDIYRDGVVIASPLNNGTFTHATGERGSGSHTYRVCEAETTICSNEVTVEY
jgi:subtilisin family serine protease